MASRTRNRVTVVAPSVGPLGVADLFAWFDPNDTASITKNAGTGAVESWTSKAGTSGWVIAQTTEAQRPIWSATGSPGNGASVAYVAASSTYLVKVGGAGNQPKTVLLAAKAAAFAGETWADAGSGINARRIYIDANVKGYAGTGVTGPTARVNEWNCVAVVFDGASSLIARDNTTDGYAEQAGNLGTAVANGLTLGAYPTPGGYCTGSIGHVLVYDRALTSAEIQRLLTWMKAAP